METETRYGADGRPLGAEIKLSPLHVVGPPRVRTFEAELRDALDVVRQLKMREAQLVEAARADQERLEKQRLRADNLAGAIAGARLETKLRAVKLAELENANRELRDSVSLLKTIADGERKLRLDDASELTQAKLDLTELEDLRKDVVRLRSAHASTLSQLKTLRERAH